MELIPQVRFYTYLHFYLPHPGSRRPSIRHKSIRLTLLFEKSVAYSDPYNGNTFDNSYPRPR